MAGPGSNAPPRAGPPADAPDRPGSKDATRDVLAQAARWAAGGRGVALATVVATWGSSPRPTGSHLAVDDAGGFEGSVSGGCVEGAVVEAAGRVIATARPELLDFGVTDEMAWEVGLACGGEMRVWVDRLSAPGSAGAGFWLEDLLRRAEAKRPVVLQTSLATGVRRLLEPEGGADDPVARAATEALRDDTCRLVEEPEGPFFLQPFNPPLRLVVVGAVHIAQPLARMAAEAGYALTIVDPRGAFATPERFPGVELCRDWPDEALSSLRLDSRSAVVTLTHDPKLDDPALAVALRSDAFYVGSLGSRRTHGRRLERLREQGLDDAALARIHGPVGLPIGARSPAEIAVSILAEITASLRRAGE